MTKKAKVISGHIQHYLPLLGILLAGGWGMYIFSYDRIFQLIITIAVGLSYVTWGIVHHHIHKDLCLSIVVEYILMASVGIAVVFSFLIV